MRQSNGMSIQLKGSLVAIILLKQMVIVVGILTNGVIMVQIARLSQLLIRGIFMKGVSNWGIPLVGVEFWMFV